MLHGLALLCWPDLLQLIIICWKSICGGIKPEYPEENPRSQIQIDKSQPMCRARESKLTFCNISSAMVESLCAVSIAARAKFWACCALRSASVTFFTMSLTAIASSLKKIMTLSVFSQQVTAPAGGYKKYRKVKISTGWNEPLRLVKEFSFSWLDLRKSNSQAAWLGKKCPLARIMLFGFKKNDPILLATVIFFPKSMQHCKSTIKIIL